MKDDLSGSGRRRCPAAAAASPQGPTPLRKQRVRPVLLGSSTPADPILSTRRPGRRQDSASARTAPPRMAGACRRQGSCPTAWSKSEWKQRYVRVLTTDPFGWTGCFRDRRRFGARAPHQPRSARFGRMCTPGAQLARAICRLVDSTERTSASGAAVGRPALDTTCRNVNSVRPGERDPAGPPLPVQHPQGAPQGVRVDLALAPRVHERQGLAQLLRAPHQGLSRPQGPIGVRTSGGVDPPQEVDDREVRVDQLALGPRQGRQRRQLGNHGPLTAPRRRLRRAGS